MCEGTGITVTRLITEDVSCLHNYTLQVNQMRAIEASQITVISGAGLEDFMEDALCASNKVFDASVGIQLFHTEHMDHHDQENDHNHHNDPHYWLSPSNAKIMVQNICNNLIAEYPQYSGTFTENYLKLEQKLQSLQQYAEDALSKLSCRKFITFHDGFSYFANAFDLTIIKAMEEESGAEASAAELIDLIKIVNAHSLPAVFTEASGSTSAAQIAPRYTPSAAKYSGVLPCSVRLG